MRVNDLIAIIEEIAPSGFAASWDRCGVQVAARRDEIEKLAVALDPGPGSVDQAMAWGADFVLTHHPLALKPDLPDHLDAYHHVLGALFARGAWLYAAHTSLDVQPGSPVRWLAGHLGLEGLTVLEPTGALRPRWFRVLGQASALAALQSELGRQAGVEIFNFAPHALELVSPARLVPAVRKAIENEASGSLRVLSQELDHPVETIGFGFAGALPEPLRWEALAAGLEQALGRSAFVLAGPAPEMIHRVACCPGSGASMLARARQAGADVFITGDLKYHDARLAEELHILVVDVGHFGLEERMMRILAEQLQRKLSREGVLVEFFPARDALIMSCVEKKGAIR